jgi:cytochrome c553
MGVLMRGHTMLLLSGGLALALMHSATPAAPSSNVAWTVETHRLVHRADAAIGAKLETVETEDVYACTACHGPAGAEPDRDRYPTLAGQMAAYTFKQLRDYKDGKRENRRMQEAVERLTDEQLAALSAWYASQPLPTVAVDEDAEVSPETVRLVYRGDKKRLIQPCASCHGRWGQGAVIDVPAIAGQNVRYFVDTMRDYASGKRANDVYSRMRIIAQALTREEIEEMAVYYARLGNKISSGGLKQANAE